MRKIIIYVVLIFLVSCASPYQKNEGFLSTGGFTDTQFDTDIFQIYFRGNGYTSKQRATDFALLRCADLTLQKGFKYFVIINTDQRVKYSSYTTPLRANTTVSATTYGSTTHGSSSTTFSGGQTYSISKPRTTNMIKLFKKKPQGFSYNATFIKNSLGGQYNIKWDLP